MSPAHRRAVAQELVKNEDCWQRMAIRVRIIIPAFCKEVIVLRKAMKRFVVFDSSSLAVRAVRAERPFVLSRLAMQAEIACHQDTVTVAGGGGQTKGSRTIPNWFWSRAFDHLQFRAGGALMPLAVSLAAMSRDMESSPRQRMDNMTIINQDRNVVWTCDLFSIAAYFLKFSSIVGRVL